MTRDPDYWKRRYERAEAARIEALNQARDLSTRLVNASHDDLQRQVDALEQLVLNRASLVGIDRDGRKLRLTFTRRGTVHRIEAYADMSCDVTRLRKELIE